VIVLDVNVVVSAFRADHPHHLRVRPWLERVLATTTPIAVPDLVWVGFVRLCTNRRVFPVPSAVDETLAFVRAVTAQPAYVHVGGLGASIDPFLDVVADSAASANLATDAYIAAVALGWAAQVATLDRDFRRFDGLRIIEPANAEK
jgi:toxin-antitoxin system PIN domain toxin